MIEGFQIIGTPKSGGVLVVGDHASNLIPASVKLGISSEVLEQHVAWDKGVAEVAAGLCEQFGFAAFLGGVSRLVVDFNRCRDDQSVVPVVSDGIEIAGNVLSLSEHDDRLVRFFDPYHAALEQLLSSTRPDLILSLHSFTSVLRSNSHQQRPWDIGVLYNEYEIASRWAIDALTQFGLVVGDQLPYSGKFLNATMNRHAEGNNIPYFGIEMKQDLVSDKVGVNRFVQILGITSNKIMKNLAR
jgi:predicted N-formylglutamate amidohydrolase